MAAAARAVPGPDSRLGCAKKVAHRGGAVAAFWRKSARKNSLAIDSGFGHKVRTPAPPGFKRV
jgi:hypothetical protein